MHIRNHRENIRQPYKKKDQRSEFLANIAIKILAKILFSSTYAAEEFYIQDMWWVLRRSNKDGSQLI